MIRRFIAKVRKLADRPDQDLQPNHNHLLKAEQIATLAELAKIHPLNSKAIRQTASISLNQSVIFWACNG
jgi:hypothetical protein